MLLRASQPGHPNVEQLTYCVVLEYCDGGDLHQALQRPTPPGFFLRVAGGVATGLAFLHGRGIMHRDLKSPNVVMREAYSESADVFSLAMILFELITHTVPFSDRSALQAAVRLLIEACWADDGRARPRASHVAEHVGSIELALTPAQRQELGAVSESPELR
ncbi:hypothetical protein EMIHUDRAFT_230951 [Emiliania huxleyi CCMP1516]|uniref:Protein kinase domain-containing protein n=2 Tax=Emiliania huxleyi TaxID=2903 RepID=A0A0D3K9F9_EMIH1|nr:hypothetical protein EMIHUDRAFT_230951 [Emiliania huxleyi CCMP1516]EOD32394.1 hypothetical protein EMIHUDRAFT_230951 [Emiliania huxleyi CCMP1516]|eukprot:XP_005784823.1 hypothetical protein EMIHUDRAFT_230951 [Emiliania huxleyi CCMP1516]